VSSPRPRAGFFLRSDKLLELGSLSYLPVSGTPLTALSIGFGARRHYIGSLVEAQLTQGPLGAELFDLNAQLRVYLPISSQLELFPLAAIGASHLMLEEGSAHLDVGVGAQFKLIDSIAIGARYQARVFGEQNAMSSMNGHQLSAQLSFRF